jgi:hypothetical protein
MTKTEYIIQERASHDRRREWHDCLSQPEDSKENLKATLAWLSLRRKAMGGQRWRRYRLQIRTSETLTIAETRNWLLAHEARKELEMQK